MWQPRQAKNIESHLSPWLSQLSQLSRCLIPKNREWKIPKNISFCEKQGGTDGISISTLLDKSGQKYSVRSLLFSSAYIWITINLGISRTVPLCLYAKRRQLWSSHYLFICLFQNLSEPMTEWVILWSLWYRMIWCGIERCMNQDEPTIIFKTSSMPFSICFIVRSTRLA